MKALGGRCPGATGPRSSLCGQEGGRQGPRSPQPPTPPADDKLEQQHSLFTRYKDPCRLGPGEEKAWAIGEHGGSGRVGRGWGRQGGDSGVCRSPSACEGWLGPARAHRALPLAPGTLLDQDGLYDEDVATPDNLQK